MSDEMLVECCAPTLAGIKTGSLFSCPCADRKSLCRELREVNRALNGCGLFLIPLRFSDRRALLYLFRPEALRRDLADRDAGDILRRAGYACPSVGPCLARLRERLGESGEFPHEIGLFLSYPPEDVNGFIQNGAKNCKLSGYWKVYGDEAAARRTFERYKKCTESYCRCLRAGISLEKLAVNL